VCKPFLANKLDKTFLDHWLLGDDLTSWLEPWAFAQLNLIEKILLARRLDATRRNDIVRCLREALELHPVDSKALDRLLDQAVAANQLAQVPAQSAELERRAAEEGKERKVAPKLQDQDVAPSEAPRALYRALRPRSCSWSTTTGIAVSSSAHPTSWRRTTSGSTTRPRRWTSRSSRRRSSRPVARSSRR
jgi:hypothetical protein